MGAGLPAFLYYGGRSHPETTYRLDMLNLPHTFQHQSQLGLMLENVE